MDCHREWIIQNSFVNRINWFIEKIKLKGLTCLQIGHCYAPRRAKADIKVLNSNICVCIVYIRDISLWRVLTFPGFVAEQFLNSTATQLTYHGLCELTSTVQEGELCVFFRNNHFSTMTKFKVCWHLNVFEMLDAERWLCAAVNKRSNKQSKFGSFVYEGCCMLVPPSGQKQKNATEKTIDMGYLDYAIANYHDFAYWKSQGLTKTHANKLICRNI